jgi:hypothetical protein
MTHVLHGTEADKADWAEQAPDAILVRVQDRLGSVAKRVPGMP